ncbi:MAG: hypothetical protein JXD23_11525 [Spirochaetales bacterium]|nr:hypothetical protein [Spirochaetales bacterium]
MKNYYNKLRTLLYLIIWTIVCVLPLSGCIITISRSTRLASSEWNDRAAPRTGDRPRTRRPAETGSVDSVSAVVAAHAEEKTPGARVLAAAAAMVGEKKIVLGACWDFVNAVYKRAGFPGAKRVTIFKEPETGPFADPGVIRPGDWVMYRNLPYGEIGHSAVFVEWIDFDKRSALTVEYVGSNRKVPGQYREADLTKVWGVIRGKD